MPENNFSEISKTNAELAKEYLGIQPSSTSSTSSTSSVTSSSADTPVPVKENVNVTPTNDAPVDTSSQKEREEKAKAALAAQQQISSAISTTVDSVAPKTKNSSLEKASKIYAKACYNLRKAIKEVVPVDLIDKKEELTDGDKQRITEKVREYMKKEFLKGFNLENCDLDEELDRIKRKDSNLSRSQRDAIVHYFVIFEWGPAITKQLEELRNKEEKTPEEMAFLEEVDKVQQNDMYDEATQEQIAAKALLLSTHHLKEVSSATEKPSDEELRAQGYRQQPGGSWTQGCLGSPSSEQQGTAHVGAAVSSSDEGVSKPVVSTVSSTTEKKDGETNVTSSTNGSVVQPTSSGSTQTSSVATE